MTHRATSSSAREREHGVVLSGTGGVWSVRTEKGETVESSLRGRLKKEREGALKLTVGDRVIIERETVDAEDRTQKLTSWAISEILPRRSELARRMPGEGHGERIVVANIDQVVVVFAAANPEPHVRMLDRFLVIAEGNDLDARIVINKIELVDKMPATFWSTIAPNEYGFYANVNPNVPHPRWSQDTERRIGELSRRPTLLFNGYAEQVASLYTGLDLKANY